MLQNRIGIHKFPTCFVAQFLNFEKKSEKLHSWFMQKILEEVHVGKTEAPDFKTRKNFS